MSNLKLSDLINIDNIRENNTEMRRTDYWLVELKVPDMLTGEIDERTLIIRCAGFEYTRAEVREMQETTIRGFKLNQATRADGANAGTFTLSFLDRVDLKLEKFFDSWMAMQANHRYMFGSPKAAVITTATVTYFDISQRPIKKYFFSGVQPSGEPFGEDGGSEEAGLQDKISVEFVFDDYDKMTI